jgi:hypothetical protein
MSAKSMCGIGYKQGAEFLGALEKAGFDGDMIQKIITNPGNGLAEKLYVTAFAATNTDFEKFELMKVIRIEVGKNPPNRMTVLKTGKKYLIKVFAIKSEVTSEDCLTFLRKQNATLLGEDGAEFLFTSGWKYQLPHDRGYVSFDELDNLFAQRDDGGIPVLLNLHAKFSIAFAEWGNGFGKRQGLLCFCEIAS